MTKIDTIVLYFSHPLLSKDRRVISLGLSILHSEFINIILHDDFL
jgi:hypothetical protein